VTVDENGNPYPITPTCIGFRGILMQIRVSTRAGDVGKAGESSSATQMSPSVAEFMITEHNDSST